MVPEALLARRRSVSWSDPLYGWEYVKAHASGLQINAPCRYKVSRRMTASPTALTLSMSTQRTVKTVQDEPFWQSSLTLTWHNVKYDTRST